MLGQCQARHAVAGVQGQHFLVLGIGQFRFTLLVVQGGQHAQELQVVGVVDEHVLQQVLRAFQVAAVGQHAELLHHQFVAAAEALFQVAVHAACFGGLAGIGQRVRQVEGDLRAFRPLLQDVLVHGDGIVHTAVLEVQVGQEEAVPDVLLVGVHGPLGHVDGVGATLLGVVELAQFVHRRTVVGIQLDALLEQACRLAGIAGEPGLVGVHEHGHHLRPVVAGAGLGAGGGRERSLASFCEPHGHGADHQGQYQQRMPEPLHALTVLSSLMLRSRA